MLLQIARFPAFMTEFYVFVCVCVYIYMAFQVAQWSRILLSM